MIQLYNASTLIKTYDTNGLWEQDFLESETRGGVYQPPGSSEAVVEGDMVDIAAPFLIPFRLNYPGNKARMTYEMAFLRNNLHTCTSLYDTEYRMWRALMFGREAVEWFAPRPENDLILDAATVRVKVRPKFGRWTFTQAETSAVYLAARDALPYAINNEPFTDGSFWSDGGGWQE
jgi:hypothetical protein